MRKALALAIIATLLAAAAYMTKPSDEACLTKAEEEFKKTKLPAVPDPQRVNSQLLAETLLANFLESLVVEDRFFYKEVYLDKGTKTMIGWGAFGWIDVDVK